MEKYQDYLSKIDNCWSEYFNEICEKEYFTSIIAFLELEYQSKNIFPQKDEVFNAFKLTNLTDLKVIIIGQDPYHTKGVADGLAFSTKTKKIPPSLRNIFKEIKSDVGIDNSVPNLTHWAKQGVLLLNTSLTVEEKKAKSHSKIGWSNFVEDTLKYLNQKDKYIYILWGNEAMKYQDILLNGHIIKGSHPSPLAGKSFFDKKYFSQTNEILRQQNKKEIDWSTY